MSTSHVIFLKNRDGVRGATAIAVMASCSDEQAKAYADRNVREWLQAYPSAVGYDIVKDEEWSPVAPPKAKVGQFLTPAEAAKISKV